MAFVFREERFPYKKIENENIVPISYLSHSDYKLQNNKIPFNSTQQRSKNVTNIKLLTPGPGAYNLIQEPCKEKVLIATQNEQIKIVEVPKEQSVFKSQSKRLPEHKYFQSPGPGSYQPQLDLKRMEFRKKMEQQTILSKMKTKQNLVEQLMKTNKYQAIPSIPSNSQIFGYTENEQRDLELNKNPLMQYSGLLNDTVGPGTYEVKSGFVLDKKGNSFSKSKIPRMNKKLTSTDVLVGPGSYDVDANLTPLYKYKPSSQFQSQQMRLFDIRKGFLLHQQVDKILGAIANQHIMENYKQQAKNLTGENLLITCDDDEYIEDAIPGPGYYHNESLSTSIKTKTCPPNLQFFGSSALRFQTQQLSTTKVGPGDYELSSLNKKVTSSIKAPFNAKKPRFFEGSVQNGPLENPGPGQYNPQTTLENKLNEKAQFGKQGQFGVNEKRFKSNFEQEELPGPGAYFGETPHTMSKPPIYFLKGYEQNYYFMNEKNANRSAFLPKADSNSPPIGTYELDQFNITKKLEKNNEIDPDLVIQVEGLGFNSSQPRFKEEQKNDDEEEEDIKINQILHHGTLSDMLKKKKEVEGLGFLNKAERFKYKQNQNPGPGVYYDSHQNLWNKRTYNIDFTGIK